MRTRDPHAVVGVTIDRAVPLVGGRTTSNVVRIGGTVRRPVGPHSVFVHRVLEHLAAKRFSASPRFLGRDREGREILSFVEGDVPRDLGGFSSSQRTAAARLLRALHDATADFSDVGPGEVVCHGDASPCNAVLRDGTPIAWIDFDAAHVGSARDDVGYAAWLWLDLGNPSHDARAQGHRLAAFFADYGAAPHDAIGAVVDAQDSLARRSAAPPPVRDWAVACREQVIRDLASLRAGVDERSTAAGAIDGTSAAFTFDGLRERRPIEPTEHE